MLRVLRSIMATMPRVWAGSMTSVMKPRLAASYGAQNFLRYSAVSSFSLAEGSAAPVISR